MKSNRKGKDHPEIKETKHICDIADNTKVTKDVCDKIKKKKITHNKAD